MRRNRGPGCSGKRKAGMPAGISAILLMGMMFPGVIIGTFLLGPAEIFILGLLLIALLAALAAAAIAIAPGGFGGGPTIPTTLPGGAIGASLLVWHGLLGTRDWGNYFAPVVFNKPEQPEDNDDEPWEPEFADENTIEGIIDGLLAEWIIPASDLSWLRGILYGPDGVERGMDWASGKETSGQWKRKPQFPQPWN